MTKFQPVKNLPNQTCHSPNSSYLTIPWLANGIRKITHSSCSHPPLPNCWPVNTAKAFLDNEHSIIMESGNERNTCMGDYFALMGDGILHSDNGDTCCKLAFHMISHRNHNDGSWMLCQYRETVVDKELEKWLPDNATDNQSSMQVYFLWWPRCMLNLENHSFTSAHIMSCNGH